MAFSSTLQFLFMLTICLLSFTNLSSAEIIELDGESGEFTSPNYPDNYPINVTVEWRISVPSDQAKIHLYFPDFSTEVFYDYVQVRDGPSADSPLLLNQDGLGASALISSGPSMYVMFHSDEFDGDRGFKAVYAQVLDDVYREEIFTEVGTLLSPHYDEMYPAGIDYSWIIKSSNIENTPIQLKFSAFDVRVTDQVEIRDGGDLASPLLGEHNGPNLPPVYYSSGGNMLIRLRSAAQDGPVTKGFMASFISAYPTSVDPIESTPPQPTTNPETTTMPAIETTPEQLSTTKETVRPEPTSSPPVENTTPNSAEKLPTIASIAIGSIAVSSIYASFY